MSPRDVFISYSHTNRDWVSGVLVPELEKRGFTTIVDYRDFRGGSFGIDEMMAAVEMCRRTLLVLTPAYVASGWTAFENAMAQSLDPDARWRRVVPMMREMCPLPLRLSILHYRDLRNDSDAMEWDRLARDLM